MEPNEETVQKRVVIDSPGMHSEMRAERTVTVPEESGVSTATVAIIAVLAILVIGIVVYVVTNRNAGESANRNANIQVASQNNVQPVPPTIIQQPAQQAPVIIQQPPVVQPAPVIVEQPAAPAATQANPRETVSDASILDIATKLLSGEPNMNNVQIAISNAQVVLTGTVASDAAKAKAERLVNGVRGVKSVENKIVVSG